jgi:hypothetical protein
MEERMVQRVDRPRLDVRVSFETTRLSPQCLIKAYTRLVPIRRGGVRKAGSDSHGQADVLARRRGGEHA